MGGYGSGRGLWPFKKDTVEDCPEIDIARMKRQYRLKPGCHTSGSLHWSRGGKRTNSINYEAHLDLSPAFIRLHYTLDGTEKVDYQVYLVTTQPNYGGLRWWFLCPNPNCRRRAGKLYLAPGSRYFLCRNCQDLTYASCQESHQLDGLLPEIARDTGMSIEEVKEALRRKELFT